MSRTKKQKKTGGKSVSSMCQNHGACSWCVSDRTITAERRRAAAVAQLTEYQNETNPET